MGTPQMSAELLEHLVVSGYRIVGLVAQVDQKVGRKKVMQEVPTKVVAKKYGIPVFQPEKIKYDHDFIDTIKPELILCFAYGQIIPESVLNVPEYGALNFHGSLLPKYRGAAPIQYALMNHDLQSGVCLMEMVKKMDAGRVYAVEKFPILESDNYESVAKKIVDASKSIVDKYLSSYLDGALIGIEQDENSVSFAPSIKSEEERIDLSSSIEQVWGLIRALSPQIGAYVIYKNQPLKIYEASIINRDPSNEVGRFIKADKGGLYLQLKDGVLHINSLQKAGKKRVSYKDFINGEKNILNEKVI